MRAVREERFEVELYVKVGREYKGLGLMQRFRSFIFDAMTEYQVQKDSVDR